jgi:hypothetical protein
MGHPAPRTQAVIFEHLRKLFPRWLLALGDLDEETLSRDTYGSLAELFRSIEVTIEGAFEQTYILASEAPYLDMLGEERGKPRDAGESDADYRVRIRTFDQAVTLPAIKALLNLLVQIPPYEVQEWEIDTSFFNRDDFLNRGDRVFTGIEGFTIYMPPQESESLDDCFYNRGSYLNRENFMGSAIPGGPGAIYNLIYDAVRNIRAAGVSHRIELVES